MIFFQVDLLLIHLTNKITEVFEDRQFGCGTFLDLSKAFDSIDHNILISKLRHYGIRGSPLSLLCNYLSNRKQYVCTNGFQSEIRETTCGVPQGSILGPLLFVIFINDVYLASSYFHTTVYADDTSLFLSGDNLRELIDKTEFKKVYLWFCTNRLMLNVKKTTCPISNHINKATSNISPYTRLINNDIPISNYAKFLGAIIDKNLTWHEHIHYISGKISKGVGILSKLKYMLPMGILKLIHNAITSPYISYCNIVWEVPTQIGSTVFVYYKIEPLVLFQEMISHYILLNFITRLIV